MNNTLHNIPKKIFKETDQKIHAKSKKYISETKQPFDDLKIAIHNRNPYDIFFSFIGALGILLILGSYFVQISYYVFKKSHREIPKSLFYVRMLGVLLSSIFLYFENIASIHIILIGMFATYSFLFFQIYHAK